MTVPITTSSIGYDCDGVADSFTYPFQILQESDLTVILTNSVGLETEQVLDIDYSVTGAGSVNGGTVVPLDPASWEVGMSITIERNTSLTQGVDFDDGEGFSAEAVEGCIDKAFLALQELDRRTMVLEVGQTPSGVSTPFYLQLSNYTDLSDAVTQIGSSRVMLVVDEGATISSDLVVPSTIQLVVPQGSVITVASGKTLTTPTPDAGRYQIFSGAGTVTGITKAFPEWWGAIADGTTDSTSAMQKAINTLAYVDLDAGSYKYSALTIPTSSQGLHGIGFDSGGNAPTTKLKHIAGAGTISWNGSTRVVNTHFSNFYLEGSGDASETYGLDLSGFSYSKFENIYVRLFQLDGIYVDGAITPTSKQFSNNTFIHCRSNNNERDGLRLDSSAPASNENSANTFTGCEFSGNGAIGVNELHGESNHYRGCTAQGNDTQDVYFNGRSSVFTGYVENTVRKSVVLGASSEKNEVTVRSSFPMFDTFADSGKNNKLSFNSSGNTDGYPLYSDPYFTRAISTTPENIALNGSSSTFSAVADVQSLFGQSLAFTLSSESFAGFIITLNATRDEMIDQWVTVFLEMDTSDLTATLAPRIYTAIDSTGNAASGEYVSELTESWDSTTTGGKYAVMAYDIKFADTAGTTPKVYVIPSYNSDKNGNVINIRSIHVVRGQTKDRKVDYGWLNKPISLAQTNLTDKATLINTFRKIAGRRVYNSTAGKEYFAIGTTDVSAWRATDGSGDLTPS